MQLVQYFSDGTLSFNWDLLPEEVKKNLDLRDKIFKELQAKVSLNEFMTTKKLFELNHYVIERIKNEINTKCTLQKTF